MTATRMPRSARISAATDPEMAPPTTATKYRPVSAIATHPEFTPRLQSGGLYTGQWNFGPTPGRLIALQFEIRRGEGRQAQLDRIGPVVPRKWFGANASRIADVRASIVG